MAVGNRSSRRHHGDEDLVSDTSLLIPLPQVKRKPVPPPLLPPHRALSSAETTSRNDRNPCVAVSGNDPEQRSVTSTSAGDEAPVQRLPRVMALWKWELASLLISLAALTAIVILLRLYRDQDLSSWSVPISINAVVAILSALFKGSLILPISAGLSQLKWIWFLDDYHSLVDMDLYDQASRGAWGSVLFIAKQFGAERMPLLATFGASLSLIVLAVDPFSQASVSINSCEQTLSKSATIPRASNYTTSGGHSGAATTELDAAMQNAVLSGLYQPPANSSVSMSVDVTCSTGNCTWPTENGVSFTTLTMCHSCVDISSLIEESDDYTYSLTGYSRDLTIASQMGVGTATLFNTTATSIALTRAVEQPFPDGPWRITSLADFQGLALVQRNYSCERSCEYIPFAFDCSLRACVKGFAANVSNGVYREQEVSREYLHHVPQGFYFQLAVSRALYNGTWKTCEGIKNRSDTHTVKVALPGAQDLGYDDVPPSLWYPTECTYYISRGASSAIGQYIGGLFNHESLNYYPGFVIRGAGWLKTLYNGGQLNISSVDVFADGLATAVGARIRRWGDYPSDESQIPREIWTSVQGQVLQTRPCINVRWEFLLYLATVLGAEVLFFTSVLIIRYRSRWDGDWKSSTLPLLFQGISPQELACHRSRLPEGEKTLYAIARPIRVTFIRVDGRWRLSTESQQEDVEQSRQ